MTILYNCRHAGDQYRITKFDDHMNVESSYLTDGKECDCLAGVRPTCRHRQMLPKFIQREHVGDEWFLDYDRGGWVQMGMEWSVPMTATEVDERMAAVEGPSNPIVEHLIDRTFEILQAAPDPTPSIELEHVGNSPARDALGLPTGVTMIVMDSPDKVEDLHNAIAEAVGEPEAVIERPKAVYIRRRI